MNPSVASPLSAEPARYRERIRVELTAILCARLPLIVLSEVVLSSAIIVSTLWEVVTPLQMALWLAAHFSLVLFHGAVYFCFSTAGDSKHAQVRWSLALSMLLQGIFWAALLAFLFAVIPDYTYRLYIFLLAGAMGVLAVALLCEDLLSFMGFVVPPLATLSIMALSVGQSRYVFTGTLGLLCVFALVLFARRRNSELAASLVMRFELSDLTHELREQRDVAERANIAKSKFLAAASHDLRQPLHALTLLTSALQSSDLTPGPRSIANDVSATVESLEKMFASLLDISRLDAGVLQPDLKHFSLDPLLRRIAAEYVTEAQTKDLRLICDHKEFTVHTDPLLLERIVRNFLVNALRYTHVGEIRITVESMEEGIRVEVADTGMGIAPEQHANIFSEFYQIANPERDRSKGLGLGLAIVRRIANLLHHPIGVESTLHQGARFFIIVPRGDPTRIERTDTAKIAQLQSLDGLRVLVIDDDASVRDSMRTLLTLWSCRVAVACDAGQAIAAARDSFDVPDALVVDYRLREHCTGTQAIEQLRAEFNAEIPALIVSGDTAPERLREVADSGHTLIHKPAQPAALRTFLLGALRVKSATL
jgi:signal transduction histidine kinase